MLRVLSTLSLLLSTTGVLAQSPARHDIVAQCPQLAELLPERLASTRQLVDRDGVVQVQLLLDPHGMARIESMDGPTRYLGPVRRALNGMDCRPSAPQRQVLTIRFEDPSFGATPWPAQAVASAPLTTQRP